MKWFLDRLKEASTWAGISAGLTFFYLWDILPDSLHKHWLLVPAMAAAVAAFMLEEGK